MASIENKIREMMNPKAQLDEAFPGMGNNKEAAPMAQGSSEKPEVQMMNVSGAAKPGNPVNNLAAGAGAMESKPMAQGSSEQASVESEDDQETQGKTQAAKMKKAAELKGQGAGAAPNFTTHADPSSVVNQASNAGNVYKEEAEVEEAVVIKPTPAVQSAIDAFKKKRAEAAKVNDGKTNPPMPAVKKEETEVEAAEEEFISEEEFNALSDEEKANYELVEMEVEAEEVVEAEVEEAYQPGDVKKKVEGAQASARAAKGEYKLGDVTKRVEAQKVKMKEELSKDVETLLSTESELSEEFKTKAASLFEAVVTARVAHEMEIMEDVLAEQAAEVVAEMHQELVNKVDAYLNYVVEQWLEQNAVAVESGLRAEVTEDFIAGLKVLFKENYIEVPEEKYDVLGEMQNQIEELTAVANASMAEALELKKALTESKRDAVFAKVTADLAQTEAEKLHGLVEEVEFDNAELFEQKLTVIKNNYFPKNVVETTALPEEQPIVEETSGTVAQYAARIARTKF